jgi:hypothetical protein
MDQLIDLKKITGRSCVEYNLDAVILNSVDLTILKWLTFELLRWMQNLHQSALDYDIKVSRPFLCDRLSHSFVTICPIVGPIV